MLTGLVIALNGVVLVSLAVGVLLLIRLAERKGFTSPSWMHRSGQPPPPETDDEWYWKPPASPNDP